MTDLCPVCRRPMPAPWIDRECVHCGKQFTTRHPDSRFCSERCRKGVARSMDDLIAEREARRAKEYELRQQGMSYAAIGKITGVTAQSVRNDCHQHERWLMWKTRRS